jgi:stage III sporulation protein SpoIIIAA
LISVNRIVTLGSPPKIQKTASQRAAGDSQDVFKPTATGRDEVVFGSRDQRGGRRRQGDYREETDNGHISGSATSRRNGTGGNGSQFGEILGQALQAAGKPLGGQGTDAAPGPRFTNFASGILFPPRQPDPDMASRNDTDFKKLIDVLTPEIQAGIAALNDKQRQNLIEVVMDIGTPPRARVYGEAEEIDLLPRNTTAEDIKAVTKNQALSAFGSDDRASLDTTLHRISRLPNKANDTIGLTLRVGRVVEGSINNLIPVFEAKNEGGGLQSVLILGRPGVGKTTLLRQVAKHLSTKYETGGENSRAGRRVVIVDTSNEIGGDGNTTHPAIGRARRYMVPSPEKQREVMQKAVENHTPETVIIDEIGDVSEVKAARTIAERGVQLIATAHGDTFEQLLANEETNGLLGGIKSVTIGDDLMKTRGAAQKTQLEREFLPTFNILLEMRDRNTVAVYPDVADAVDRTLRGEVVEPEIIHLNSELPKAKA